MGRIFIVAFVLIGLTQGSFHDDMSALEKDLESLHMKSSVKKAINDMTTEELVNELKREVGSINTKHHDAFRSRFHDVVSKKSVEDALWENTMRADDRGCTDTRSDCAVLKPYCQTHKAKLYETCKRTCGWCQQCKDDYLSCPKLAERGQCVQQRERMSEICKASCGVCKAPASPKCSQTEFGCCWNRETTKTDEKGNNCPECADDYKFVCKTFDADCKAVNLAGDFMRRHCPQTCDLCSNTACTDSPYQAALCPTWKTELGWCDTKKDVMRHFCPKTCKYC